MTEENNLIESQGNGTFRYFPFRKKIQALLILVAIAFVYYINTVKNETVFDDGINIHQNGYVLKGIRGIPEILVNDSYRDFYNRMNASDQLQGGRYKPFTTISFAIEQEFIHTYRTGYYNFCNDLNHNNQLNFDKVPYQANNNEILKSNYEFNDFEDINGDGQAQANECLNCWDLNRNFKNDVYEDVNHDGIYNEVDCQVEGISWRHFNNVIIYILLVIMLFKFMDKFVFPHHADISFLVTLLFLIHPLNTESVASVSRRDELFSLLFILFTLYFSFMYVVNNRQRYLALSAIGMLFALMSKEYGIVLPILIPVGIYTLLKIKIRFKELAYPVILFIAALAGLIVLKTTHFLPASVAYFYPASLIFILVVVIAFVLFKKDIVTKGIPLLLTVQYLAFLFYIILRFNATNFWVNHEDNEVLNNSYLFATGEERFCTKITVLLYYLKLLVFPITQVCDYSYDSIVFLHFTSWQFLFSLILNSTILIIGIRLVIKQHIIGFAIMFYFLFLLVLGNFLIFTGTIMNEHFVFHSTVGFCMVVGWGVITFFEKFRLKPSLIYITLILPVFLLVILSGKKVMERNRDWSNDITLFLHDVKNAPNSIICLGNAGARWIDLADTREITGISIPGQDTAYFNDYNGNLVITDDELKQSGYKTKREVALHKGVDYLERAIQLHPRYVNGYLNLGLAEFKLGEDLKAIYYWKKAEMLYPNNPYLMNYYAVAGNQYRQNGMAFLNVSDPEKAIEEFKKSYFINPKDIEALKGLYAGYFNLGKYNHANYYKKKVDELESENKSSPKKKEKSNKETC